MKAKEPKLCPDCPLTKPWKDEAVRRIRERQYTREKAEPSALKICMERRKILHELGLECPYYPENEKITQYQTPLLMFTERNKSGYWAVRNTETGEGKLVKRK